MQPTFIRPPVKLALVHARQHLLVDFALPLTIKNTDKSAHVICSFLR